MMQAGKDYLTKADAEYESPRALYLRELLKSVKAQGTSAEIDAAAKVEDEPVKAAAEPVKPTNQNKPTLKLK
jgi:hypothetical protein